LGYMLTCVENSSIDVGIKTIGVERSLMQPSIVVATL
jgi:hypothetical protein